MLAIILSTAPFVYFFLLPFIYFPKIADSYELPKVIVYIVSIYFYIGLYLFGILSNRINFVKLNKPFCAFIALVIVYTIGSVINGFPSQSLWGQYFRYQGLLTLYCYGLFLILFAYLLKTEKNQKIIQKIITFSHLFLLALILLQGIAVHLFQFPIYTYNERITGFLGNPNFIAAYLALSFPYSFFFLQSLNIKNGRYYLMIFSILCFVAIILTGSRSGLLGYLAILFIIFIEKSKKYLALLLIPVALILTLVLSTRDFNSQDNRLLIWQRGLSAFIQKPLLGWGVENFETAISHQYTASDINLRNIRVDKAHNEFLEVLVAGGLLGFACYLALIIFTLMNLWRHHNQPWPKTNLYALIIYLIICQLNVLNLTSYLFFYLIIAASKDSEIPTKVSRQS